ncbi:MAG: hypothetical protein IKO51_08235 [Clostridia bacterium]|nr:hypothetical protein [Clostridia bacterium]
MNRRSLFIKLICAALIVPALVFAGCTPTVGPETSSPVVTAEPHEMPEPSQAPDAESTDDAQALTCFACVIDANGEPRTVGTVRETAEELVIWEFSSQMTQRDGAPAELTASFDGIELTGEYGYSLCVNRTSYVRDHYKNGSCSFEVDPRTGATVGFTRSIVFDDEIEAENAKPELADPAAGTEALAREYAGKLVDLTEYELKEAGVLEWNKPESMHFDYYDYVFCRKVLGEDTMDRIAVKLTSKGSFVSFCIYEDGAFDPLPDDIGRFEGADIDGLIASEAAVCFNRSGLAYEDLAVRERSFCVSPVDGSTVMLVIASLPGETDARTGECYIIIK